MLKVEFDYYDTKIKELFAEYDKVYKEIVKPIADEIQRLGDEKNYLIFKKEIYGKFPLDKQYYGKEIALIEFLCKDGSTKYLFNDGDIFEVDQNGYPYYSSYDGIYRYDEDANGIIGLGHGFESDPGFIGYICIKFTEDEEIDEC